MSIESKPTLRNRKFEIVRRQTGHDDLGERVTIEDREEVIARNYTTTANGDIFFIDVDGVIVAAFAAGAWDVIYNRGEVD